MLWVNAGHVPPLLQTQSGIVRLMAATPPLGVLPDLTFEVQRTELAPGDRLLAYTDGVTEARDAAGSSMFGEKGLSDWLLAQQDMSLAELPQSLLAHLRAFSGDEEGVGNFDDDVTILCVQRERV